MLKSKKNVFWEAFLITILVFLIGFLIGVYFEISRTDQIENYYSNSEISLMDMQAMQELMKENSLNCDALVNANLVFADKIYLEAKKLEKYDDAEKVTSGIELAHKKYDVMRTLLWRDSIQIQKSCSDSFDVIVYVYDYDPEDLAKKATQSVWSKVLADIKQERGSEIVLIPIAYSEGLVTLEALLKNFEVESLPAVIINDEVVLSSLESSEELNSYLN